MEDLSENLLFLAIFAAQLTSMEAHFEVHKPEITFRVHLSTLYGGQL